MRRVAIVFSLLVPFLAPMFLRAADFRAGVARVDITPAERIWMAGYAARTHPSDGVAQRLWVKALVLEDARGHKVVVVTMDLLRVPRAITDAVLGAARERYGLKREEVLLNCSHNHSGPTLWENDPFTALAPSEYEISRRYTLQLSEKFVDLIGRALKDLAPADVLHGTGSAGFGANRRVSTAAGYEIGYNPNGPVDHRVPFLEVVGPKGDVRAVLFGYACHNTTIGPASYEIGADYAGFAQSELERVHAGCTAMFLQLCAGDQDPYPRGGKDVAERHGKELASAVVRVPRAKLEKVRGPIGTAFESVSLSLAPHTRAMFEKRLNDSSPARVRNARAMLSTYDQGHPIQSVSFPVQAIRLGRRVSIVALGGEPVVDYALRAQRELPGVILAGYSNLVMSYVPSKRVLAEGGYEAGDSMIYYGLPTPYTPDVEDTVFAAIRRVLAAARK